MGNTPPSNTYTHRNNDSSSTSNNTNSDGSSRTDHYHQQRQQRQQLPNNNRNNNNNSSFRPRMRSFPGSVLLESTLCGTLDSTDDHTRTATREQERLWKRVDQFGLCSGGNSSFDRPHHSSHPHHSHNHHHNDRDVSTSSGTPPRRQNSVSEYSSDDSHNKADTTPAMNATSALFARALVSEVTDNPKTMTPAAMAEREKKLLRAQEAAKKKQSSKDGPRPVGAPGGIGQPNLLGSIAQAITGNSSEVHTGPTTPSATVLPPNSLQENRAQQQAHFPQKGSSQVAAGALGGHALDGSKYSVTIGLSLSRRHSTVGHPDTVTRQTAFDFNELQDRQYKYVSSTDSSGWRAGGGERGGDQSQIASAVEDADALVDDFGSASLHPHGVPRGKHPSPTANNSVSSQSQPQQFHKVAAPDTVHIPIIQIDAASPQAVDAIISALARGEIFIPHMAVLPESLSVNGISPPDLVVRFGCERNDDVPPDEWPNWCLEFMHNQLYEYFHNMGARWMKRPFSITLARKVRWKTVKHMNRYFAHAERVIDAWREKGPQYLDPQLSYIEGGATPEEVARPHGIYLLRNGVPTNYFAPNFDPPYTTKMTRSLLLNVLGKSWDKKRREWTTEPIPRLVTPSMLMAHMCGCADPGTGGFMANEVTHVGTSLGASHISDQRLVTLDQHQHQPPPPQQQHNSHHHQHQHQQHQHHQHQHQNQQQSHHRVDTSTAAFASAMPAATPAGIVPATSPPGARSSGHSTASGEEFSQGSRSSRRRSRRQNQHAAPHMHVPTTPSVTSSSNTGVPVAAHLKSPAQPMSPVSSLHSSSVTTQEEKKIDDDPRRQAGAEAPGKYLTFRADGQSIQDPPPAAGQKQGGRNRESSVANSGTTVMHDNLLSSAAQRIATKGPASSLGVESKQTIQSSNNSNKQLSLSSSSSWNKKKKKGGRSSLDGSSDGGVSSMESSSRSPRHSPSGSGLPSNDSGVSLEYSLDSHSMAAGEEQEKQEKEKLEREREREKKAAQSKSSSSSSGVGGSSMMLQFAEANHSPRPSSTKSSRKSESQSRQKQQHQVVTVTEDDDALSLQDSASSEVIPTDEELFVVGWAKALDPSSGNYYYFTLDRTKTVWENPLSADTFVSGESSYFSGSGFSGSRSERQQR